MYAFQDSKIKKNIFVTGFYVNFEQVRADSRFFIFFCSFGIWPKFFSNFISQILRMIDKNGFIKNLLFSLD